MYFWRLGFAPIYHRDAITAALTVVFNETDVHSFVIYEIAGPYDILLRIWLPTSTSQSSFETSLRRQLAPLRLQTMDFFVVTDCLRHWVWDDGRDGVRVPTLEVIEKRLPEKEISEINASQCSEELFQRLTALNLLAETPFTSGIKFSIVIPRFYAGAPSVEEGESLGQRVGRVLADAAHVKEGSLYRGVGFAQFLIMGKVDYEDYLKIFEELVDPIMGIGISDFLGTRTYTQVNAAPDFLRFQEFIPTGTPASQLGAISLEVLLDQEESVEALLGQEESLKLEVKGSALVDLGRWLHSQKDDVPQPSEVIAVEEFLKPIVGMLNARGGVILLGALELERFTHREAREKLAAYPTHGKYVCVGIEPDMQGKGWDWYSRALRDPLATRITPSASLWVDLEQRIFEDVPMCLISVRAPEDQNFYLIEDTQKPHLAVYYVREGNRTRPLGGLEADLYKQNRWRR